MPEPIHTKIKQSLHATEDLYHRLVLLVGETGSGKTDILKDMANELGTSVININLTLSQELLELTNKQRALRLPKILDQIIDKAQPLVILDNIELLFDSELKQDPLRLLQSISRNRTVLASWNGTFTNKRLIYAEPNHPEHRMYDSIDTLIVRMDGTSSIDSATTNSEARQA